MLYLSGTIIILEKIILLVITKNSLNITAK